MCSYHSLQQGRSLTLEELLNKAAPTINERVPETPNYSGSAPHRCVLVSVQRAATPCSSSHICRPSCVRLLS